jgi:dienelactone hydrolase
VKYLAIAIAPRRFGGAGPAISTAPLVRCRSRLRQTPSIVGVTIGHTIVLEFADTDFRHQLNALLIQARSGAASVDEVQATAGRIADGDAESWVLEWIWAAGQAWSTANHKRDAGATRHAGSAYLHAASYYAAALSQMLRSDERQRAGAVWRRQRWCWDQATTLAYPEATSIEIPYLDTSLPGHFFPIPDATGRRPLVIMHNGIYRPTSAMLGLGGAAAAARGYHWMTFDGPGQQAALHQRGLFLRPDWETVLTPVVDAMLARDDVDPDRIAVIGVGHAGYLLPRALAREHRLAAVAIRPGIIDVAAPWRDALPVPIRAVLADGDIGAFDRALHAELLANLQAESWLRACALPFGVADALPSRIFQTISEYQLGEQLESVRTPTLIIDGGTRPSWPGQSQALHNRLAGVSELRALHNDPSLHERQLLDWLEAQLK